VLRENQEAPDFQLTGIDEDGQEKVFSLRDFAGRKVVLYFYPKDNTPGCTVEACDFRDSIERLKSAGAVVLGVSPDSVKSHVGFRDKQSLTFPLLSDPDKAVASAYGAYGEKKVCGKVKMGIIRTTVIIDEKGLVQKVWRGVKVKGHVQEVFEAL